MSKNIIGLDYLEINVKILHLEPLRELQALRIKWEEAPVTLK